MIKHNDLYTYHYASNKNTVAVSTIENPCKKQGFLNQVAIRLILAF